MNLRKAVIRNGTQAVLKTLAWLARRPGLHTISAFVTRRLALATVRVKNIKPVEDLEALGHQWQRSFPSKKQVPLVAITDETVYAEIHTPCPLRGTGDVHACYRMMNFDRTVLGEVGGEFVVLESQATPGRTFCTVAIRRAGAEMSDLVAAHERDAAPKPTDSTR